MTNEEYIKSMTTEELAVLLKKSYCCLCTAKTSECNSSDRYLHCEKTIINWLKREKEQ